MVQRSAQSDLVALLPSAKLLGFAGLAPQVVLAAAAFSGAPDVTPVAARLALCYPALILSFIGGAWWGLAAQPAKRAPSVMWLIAVVPSLVAFGALGALILGRAAEGLAITGAALIFSPVIDYKLAKNGWCPRGWLCLRTPLSLGLGFLTLLVIPHAP